MVIESKKIHPTVLVTGAGGYIGRHVVAKLLDLGTRVIAVDIQTTAIDKRATSIKFDIFNEKISQIINEFSPSICLHLAWKDGFIHNSLSHIEYLPRHFDFLRDVVECGVNHIAVMGTMHEIGYWEGEVTENTPTNPTTYYGIAKNTLRQALNTLSMEKNIVFQWFRAFYITGDDYNNHSIFAKLLQMENEGRSLFPFTTGENRFDFIDIDELSFQIATALLQTEVTGIINCCSGKPIMLKEIVENFLVKNHLKIKLDYGKYPNRIYDSPILWGNTEKIRHIIERVDRNF